MVNMKRKLFVIILSSVAIIWSVIITGCGGHNVKPVADPQTQFDRAMKLYEKEKYYDAETEFQRFIYNYPGNTAVDTAQYYLGLCYYDDDDYALAAGEFNKLLTSFPVSEFSDDAQFKLAMSHYHQSPNYSLDQTDTYIAIDEFLNFVDTYSASELYDSASIYLGELRNKLAKKDFKTARLYQKMKRFDPAITYYSKQLEDYPDSPFSEESTFRVGECYLKIEKDVKAREAFLKYLDNFENGRFHENVVKILRELEDKPKAEL